MRDLFENVSKSLWSLIPEGIQISEETCIYVNRVSHDLRTNFTERIAQVVHGFDKNCEVTKRMANKSKQNAPAPGTVRTIGYIPPSS